MKLLRLGEPGLERPAVLLSDGRVAELGDLADDIDAGFFRSGGIARVREFLTETGSAHARHVEPTERIGAPIARPHQIICVGLNYSDHARETGQDVPTEPILFTKSPNTLVGPNDDVRMPRGATKLDWEVELGIVIGARAYELDSDVEAEAAIAGYVLVNDVSERAFQLERGGQWLKGKSAPTFNPTGPWLVSADEITDVLDLGMHLYVNGVNRQAGSTATMIFDPVTIVRYISQFLALEPGDLINTGTPPGVGMGMTPPEYLREGDVMELAIDGLGVQRQVVVGRDSP